MAELDTTSKSEQQDGASSRQFNLCDVPVSICGIGGGLRMLDGMVADGGNHFVCFLEGNLLSRFGRDDRVVPVLQAADAVLADGIAVTAIARLRGLRHPRRAPGPSFILAACEYGLTRGWRHFFYGGQDGVADQLAEEFRQRFRGIRIVGTYAPPFRPLTSHEEADVKARIEESGADLLWVGIGGPKQEFWMADHVGKIEVPVMLGVGAAFDFHSGNRPWAPPLLRRLGVEWIWRTVTGGPKTFSRNIRCVSTVLWLLTREVFRAPRRGNSPVK